jgi:hypothetical protein
MAKIAKVIATSVNMKSPIKEIYTARIIDLRQKPIVTCRQF